MKTSFSFPSERGKTPGGLFSKKSSANPLLDFLVVGQIIKVDPHPNADRLRVCTVDIGNTEKTVVCGGINVRQGMLTAYAAPGVKVYLGGGPELVEIKATAIRGVPSDGMLCGPDEIGLADRFPKKAEKEIIDLSSLSSARPGQKLSDLC